MVPAVVAAAGMRVTPVAAVLGQQGRVTTAERAVFILTMPVAVAVVLVLSAVTARL